MMMAANALSIRRGRATESLRVSAHPRSSERDARIGLRLIFGEKESRVLGTRFYPESQKRAALSGPTSYRLLLATTFQPEAANDQLVAGFSRPENLSATRDGPRFSGSTTQPGKVQLSGGSEWLEAKVGAPFPRNWGWRSLNNLSYRIFPSAAVVRRQSWAFTRSSTTFCYCSIWAASGRSCRSKRMAKVVLKFTTRASIAPGGGGRPMAVSTPFLPAQWCSCTGTTFSISRCFTAMARPRQPKRAAITSALAGTRR